MGHTENFEGVVAVEYFIRNNIEIKEIECGAYHSMMIDYDGRVWIFAYGADIRNLNTCEKRCFA